MTTGTSMSFGRSTGLQSAVIMGAGNGLVVATIESVCTVSVVFNESTDTMAESCAHSTELQQHQQTSPSRTLRRRHEGKRTDKSIIILNV